MRLESRRSIDERFQEGVSWLSFQELGPVSGETNGIQVALFTKRAFGLV
jgi:hypothetical protein